MNLLAKCSQEIEAAALIALRKDPSIVFLRSVASMETIHITIKDADGEKCRTISLEDLKKVVRHMDENRDAVAALS